MPGVAAPIIAAIITSATGAGVAGLELANQPGTPSPQKQLQAETPAAVSQLQQARAIEGSQAAQALPGIQENTSGGVSPAYLQQMSALISGNGDLLGTPQLSGAVNQFLGLPNSGVGTGSLVTGGGGSNILNSILPGLTGGGQPSPGITNATQDFFGFGGSQPGQPGNASSANPFATLQFAF